MSRIDDLIRVLDVSIERNGAAKPLTLGHLRNLLALADRQAQTRDHREGQALDDLAAECTDKNG